MFNLYEDMTKIVDSMQLDSGTTVCDYTEKGYLVTIEVRGDVRVEWNPEGLPESGQIFRSPCEFPKELKELIAKGDDPGKGVWWTNDERVYVIDNNWFEIFVWKVRPGNDEYLCSDVIDAEGLSPKALETICKDTLESYLKSISI